MRILGFLMFFLLVFVSCNNTNQLSQESPLVEINGRFLYNDDLRSAMPFGLSHDDSLLFAQNYIRTWAEDVLLFEKAKENIRDDAAINELVENYRRSLIVHAYQQEMINQRLSSNIAEEEITQFYENNKELFVVKRPLIKGLFIKVPVTAPQMNDLRRWYKTETYEAVENLEKYSLLNAVSYDYFYDKWTTLSDILGKMPLKEADPGEYINKNRQVELQDTAFYYLLNVTDYLGVGDQEPYDFARAEAKDMLTNVKKIDFIREIKADLYEDALRSNKIKFKN